MLSRWISPPLLAGLLLLAPSGVPGCTPGDPVAKGCTRRADCPRPDRQFCEVETGVCVGFTSLPGQVDGGDGEGIDGGLDAGP